MDYLPGPYMDPLAQRGTKCSNHPSVLVWGGTFFDIAASKIKIRLDVLSAKK